MFRALLGEGLLLCGLLVEELLCDLLRMDKDGEHDDVDSCCSVSSWLSGGLSGAGGVECFAEFE